MNLNNEKHISISQINLYLRCSLKYRFQYLDKMPKVFKPSALAFGSAIHSSIEWLHKEKMQGKERTLEEVLSTFEVDWFSQTIETDIHYKERENEETLKETGQKILALYYQYERSNGKTTASECPFEVPIVNLRTGEVLDLSLQGFIDLIENGETIVEIKTSAHAMDLDTLNNHLQLTTYAYAFSQLFNQEPKELKVINLIKAKTPKIQVLTTKRNPQDYERFFYTAEEVISGIKAGVFIPNPSFICKECEYAEECLKWRGNDFKAKAKEEVCVYA